ncbi:uncharacterized protein PV09_03654 [Verruconis gallopava]|uniref:non-specific serine/threonine protein kinase n=1 Tax=Verruconis gallopava TaxID=253628 RepID=A0A0D1YWN3_9PEZI|nr:uncharacterized protein PV09_03654 [Verruconis gallopava]KIW05097.1 hypothetical protein PV09_03654 [Verruconis gallopava]
MTLAPESSQVSPLPTDLPFRIVSKTIGSGAYASIRKAVPLKQSSPVIAIKFINKEHAFKRGRIKPKNLEDEVKLHAYLGAHRNIIQFYAHGADTFWVWIAMELASNGDLFDKIEADVGVGEDIAHLYFTQLMSAVGYMHSKGIAHRDLKPENILVGENGDLKLADFGLAALYKKGNEMRLCNTVCGSPPYIAPEVVNGKRGKRYDVLEQGYAPHVADLWSCGVILFTLLVGNTPWDEPTERSYEFKLYLDSGGKMGDELWEQLPKDTLSLLRGMMKLEPSKRFTLEEIRSHPWMRRTNPIMDASGRAKDPVALATKMMENLKVNFQHSTASQRQTQRRSSSENMEIDSDNMDLGRSIAATQPETPLNDFAFEWERPMSQPVYSRPSTQPSHDIAERLTEDPTLSQFTQTPSVPLSLTQIAKRFGDIVPATPLTQFLSARPADLLISTIIDALAKLRVPASPIESLDAVHIRIKTRDGRGQNLNGQVIISPWSSQIFEVRFVKLKGDPLEWRRFFKNVCAYCKDFIIRPDEL